MSYIFIKLQWSINPISTILYYTDFTTGELIKQRIVVGDELHIKIEEGNYCIGTELESVGWISCAIHNKLANNGELIHQKLASGRQCESCTQDDYYACRKYCKGDYCRPSSTIALAKCQPAVTGVYITMVGNEMKVGVSLNTERRWLEQGSDYGVKVADLPGLDARYLEETLAKELNYKLQVAVKRKMQDLRSADKNTFQIELTKNMQHIYATAERIKEERRVEGTIYPTLDIVDLTKHYGDALQQIEFADTFSIVPNSEFGGKIVGIKGSLIIVQVGSKYAILNTKQLAGYKFALIEKANMNVQTSLSDWF